MRAGLRYRDNHVVMKFFSKYLFLWWHELANSLRLLRLHGSFLQIIKLHIEGLPDLQRPHKVSP